MLWLFIDVTKKHSWTIKENIQKGECHRTGNKKEYIFI